MHMINLIGRCQNVFRTDNSVADDLAPCHHSFVFAISKNPGLTQEQLSRKLCLNKSTVTRTVFYLEEHGYVRREASLSDKRSLLVYPTEKMEKVFLEVRAIAARWRDYLLSDFSPEELSEFSKTLEKLTNKAQDYVYCKDESV